MTLTNHTKHLTSLKVVYADSFTSRLKGLMFRTKPLVNEALIIKPCNSIHMFFMFFAIDVVFINDEHRIIKTVTHLKPWRIVWPVKGATAAIELPVGTVQKYELAPGKHLYL